jgi:hypothetical protein
VPIQGVGPGARGRGGRRGSSRSSPCGLVGVARGRGVQEGGVGSGGRGGCRVGDQPTAERVGAADAEALLLDVALDDAVQVAVELGAGRPRWQAEHAGEAGREQRRRGSRPGSFRSRRRRRAVAGQEGGQADARVCQAAFGDGEGPHPERDDPARTGVHGCLDRGGAAGEEEPPGGRAVVDGAAHEVPALRPALPFVEQHGARRRVQLLGGRVEQGPLGAQVEPVDGVRSARGGGGLADALRALEGDGGQAAQERVQLGIDDAMPVRSHERIAPDAARTSCETPDVASYRTPAVQHTRRRHRARQSADRVTTAVRTPCAHGSACSVIAMAGSKFDVGPEA